MSIMKLQSRFIIIKSFLDLYHILKSLNFFGKTSQNKLLLTTYLKYFMTLSDFSLFKKKKKNQQYLKLPS